MIAWMLSHVSDLGNIVLGLLLVVSEILGLINGKGQSGVGVLDSAIKWLRDSGSKPPV